MSIEVEGPDGAVHEFPEGTAPDVIRSAMAKHYAVQPSVASDVVKSAASGVGQGMGDVAGMAGDARDAADWVSRNIPRVAGGEALSPEQAQARDTAQRNNSIVPRLPSPLDFLPSSEKVNNFVGNLVGGWHKPETTAGEYAGTIGRFAPMAAAMPGKLGANLASGTAGAVASETGGQLTKGTEMEPYARLAGALGGSMALPALSRAITPNVVSPERQALVDALQSEGVPLTAGQKTGSKPLQWAESHLGDLPGSGGAAQAMKEQQLGSFTAAALRRAGVDSERATPAVVNQGFKDIGSGIDAVTGRNTLSMDPQFAHDIGQTVQTYIGNVNPAARAPAASKWAQDIIDIAQNGAQIDGRAYQQMRSRLTNMAQSTGDNDLRNYYKGLRNSLDSAMERSVQATNPTDAGSLGELRSQWGNLKDISRASGAGGEMAAQGYITPQQLRMQIGSGNNRTNYARGNGDMAELTRAGNAIMPQLANSGTPARHAAERVLAAPAAAIGGAAAGPLGFVAGGLAPFAPGLAGRALMSAPVQKYLANQAMASRPFDMTPAARALLVKELMASSPQQIEQGR